MKPPLSSFLAEPIKDNRPELSSFDESQASLAHSQAIADKIVKPTLGSLSAQPVQDVQNVAQGAAKGGIKVLSSGLSGLTKVGGFIEKGLDKVFGTNTAQNAQKGAAAIDSFTEQPGLEYTNTAQKVGGVIGNIAGGLIAPPTGKAEMAASVAQKAPGVIERAAAPVLSPIKNYLAQRAEKRAVDITVKALTPKLTPKEVRGAATAGKGTTGFGGTKIDMTKDKAFMEMANNAKGLVKGKSAVEDINTVRDAIGKEAESLKTQIQAVDHPYTFRELASKLSSTEEPISLRGTPFEKQIKPIKEAAVEIAKGKKGNISGLLDARKEFDELVDRTYPNLWDKENAPMRSAITSIRNAMNDFIEANLPEGAGYRESLGKQRMFYDAIDNLATKVPEEIKKGGVVKKILKNPIVQAVGAATGANWVVNKLTND